MELTFFSDYSLRTLIYLGLHRERLCSIAEIADNYKISRNHLMKVVNGLARAGFIKTYRGRGGGMSLAREPEAVRLGALVRATEGPFRPVECYRPTNGCVITGGCVLPEILNSAFENFVVTLDRFTLGDLLKHSTRLNRQLSARAAG